MGLNLNLFPRAKTPLLDKSGVFETTEVKMKELEAGEAQMKQAADEL